MRKKLFKNAVRNSYSRDFVTLTRYVDRSCRGTGSKREGPFMEKKTCDAKGGI